MKALENQLEIQFLSIGWINKVSKIHPSKGNLHFDIVNNSSIFPKHLDAIVSCKVNNMHHTTQ